MDVPTDLIRHLTDRLGLDKRLARRVLEEVNAYFAESPEAFVLRRHQELQREGLKNAEIFAALQVELRETRFPGPNVSARQIRRWIYG